MRRFFTKFLRDEGYLDFDEPFLKMRHQGMILGPDNKKMSKSKGNVIDPDKVINEFGADTLRIYEMFMGPIEADKPWSTESVRGVYRFLRRVFRLGLEVIESQETASNKDLERKLHQTIKKVTEDIPDLKFNTSVAMMMEFVNEWEALKKLSVQDLQAFVHILAPFAPFLAEELFQRINGQEIVKGDFVSVHTQDWPKWDGKLIQKQNVAVVIQVNGKVRSSLDVQADLSNDKAKVIALAQSDPKLEKWLKDKKVIKEIFIPGNDSRPVLVNFVVK